MENSPVVKAVEGEHSGTKEVQLPKPKISLADLIFIICVHTDAKKVDLARFGDDLKCSNDRFLIEVERLNEFGVTKSGMDDVTIKWEVIYKKDWDDCVTIFDVRKSLDTNFGWLIYDLSPSWSGLVADVKVSFKGELLDKISLEICTERERTYYSPDDTLRYLEWFFDPNETETDI